MKDSIFYKQAELVLRILPDILVEEIFALKGGTAINFFFRDLPRHDPIDPDVMKRHPPECMTKRNFLRTMRLLLAAGAIPLLIPERVKGVRHARQKG